VYISFRGVCFVPVSHWVPVYPGAQRHRKLLIWSSQVPPFWQGCEAHSSTSTETGRKTKEVLWLYRRKPKSAGKVMLEVNANGLAWSWYRNEENVLWHIRWIIVFFFFFKKNTSWPCFSWLISGRQLFITPWRVCRAQQTNHNPPIWHRRPVKPVKQEQVKEELPVMQSSMHWPPFRHGRRCGHTDAREREREREREVTRILKVPTICRRTNLWEVLLESLQPPTSTFASSIRKTHFPG